MKPDTVNSYHERISRALTHIQQNLDGSLTLEELAGVACFSPFHFHRVFRGMVGEAVGEHVRRLRLERAARQLQRTESAILEIALEAGYETHESFTRAFAETFGMPPSEFRRTREASLEARLPAGAPSRASGFRVRRLEAMRVAFIRHVGPYDEVGKAWSKLYPWAARQGLLGAGTRVVGICHDDPDITPPDKLRYDAALIVNRPVARAGEIGAIEIPAGEYASALHTGPHQCLSDSYAELAGKWLPGTGRELRSAAALEFYLDSPQTTPAEELRTEICLPLVAETRS
jgi:AraC family transcriptional regulator